ncbi:cellulose biosynthesis protein BcsF [Stutzerimonas sp. NM35]|uniref:cellulose biosynthesis protein BcsF n=1 Tax=Stutzerimonas stutzeri TaxID=316 RepID=UPI0015E36C30|nr:cellulose biosynthesis protein BcsF [Stutzerimonas stutzeri]MBA1261958.1 cellulose biosynthesis protein BcsF [Stutzerimonas stutzeri]
MTSSWLFQLALLFIGLGTLLGLLLATYWRPVLRMLDRLLPPRHLRRAGVRYRSQEPEREDR